MIAGERDPLAVGLESAARARSAASETASHAAPAGELGHQPGRAGRRPRGVLEREGAGDVGGGDLALGVADDGGGLDAAGAPEPARETITAKRAGWTTSMRSSQLRRPRPRRTSVKRPVDVGRERLLAARRLRARRRRGLEQLERHPRPLRALAGEDEGELAARRGRGPVTRPGLGSPAARASRPPSSCSRSPPTATARCSKAGAGGGERVGDVASVELGVGLAGGRRGGRPARAGPARSSPRAAGGSAPAAASPAGLRLSLGLLGVRSRLGRRLLEDQVGVGAADAEGGDAGAARAARSRCQGSRLGQQLDLARPPSRCAGRARRRAGSCGSTPSRIASTILITPATPAAAWVWPMLDLIEPSRSGLLAVLAVGGEQGAGLDRVAERGAGAVGLDRVDVGGGEPGVGQRLADHPLLRGAVGGGEAVARRRPG